MNHSRRPRRKPVNEPAILAELDAICSKLNPEQAERALEWLAHKHVGPLVESFGDTVVAFVKFTEGYGVKRGDLVKFVPGVQRDDLAVIMVNDAGIPIGTVTRFDRAGLNAVRGDDSVILWEVLKVEAHGELTAVAIVETDEVE